jgi:hypothetical protein
MGSGVTFNVIESRTHLIGCREGVASVASRVDGRYGGEIEPRRSFEFGFEKPQISRFRELLRVFLVIDDHFDL